MRSEQSDISYRMEVLRNPDFLLIQFFGILNRRNSQQIIDDIVLAVNGNSHRRVLVDYRALDSKMTFLDYYNHVHYAARQLYTHTHKVAFLVSKETYDKSPFFVSVATNRGLQLRYFRGLQLQYFHKERDAIEWLTGDTTQ